MNQGDNSYGNPDLWATAFPTNLIPKILILIINTWLLCLSKYRFTSDDHETSITRRFKYLLQEEKNMRNLPVRIQREMPEEVEDDDANVKEKGRIDLAFLYGCRENVYFALECKRLNVSYNGKKRSLATDYVGEDGLFAFVKEWYSVGLDQAGMIGYVMDGDIDDAQRKVNKIIQKNKDKLKTDNGFKTSSVLKEKKQIKETIHSLSTHKLCVHHVFLSVRKPFGKVFW